MMPRSKTLLLGTTVVASSLLLSACIPGLNKLLNRDAATQPDTTSTQGQSVSQMMAALQSGQSLKCDVTSTTDNQTFEYYLKGGKFRMDGTTIVDSQAQTTHAINDTAFIYTWTDEQNQGVKMRVPTAEELAEQSAQYQDYANKYPDLTDENVVRQYEETGFAITCDPTSVSDDLFVPPTTIQFQDLSAMMESAAKLMKDAPAGGQMTPEQLEAYQKAMENRPQ